MLLRSACVDVEPDVIGARSSTDRGKFMARGYLSTGLQKLLDFLSLKLRAAHAAMRAKKQSQSKFYLNEPLMRESATPCMGLLCQLLCGPPRSQNQTSWCQR